MMALSQSRTAHWLGSALRWLILFSPALVIFYLFETQMIGTPMWDDWERGPLYEKLHAGELSWRDLWRPHIEHRILTARLFHLLSEQLWNARLEPTTWLSGWLALGAAILMAVLIRRSLGTGRWSDVTIFATNMLLFSPIQYNNFLWDTQMPFFIVPVCLVGLLLLLGSSLSHGKRLAGGAALCLLGTVSFSTGLFLWGIMACWFLFEPGQHSNRRRGLFAGIAVVLWVAITVYYFVDFSNDSAPQHSYGQGSTPVIESEWRASLQEPQKLGIFYCSLIGITLSKGTVFPWLPLSVVIGLGVSAIILLAGMWLLIRWRQEALWSKALPWVAMGGFSLVAAAVGALGRSALHHDIKEVLSPRYSTLTFYSIVAVIGLLALLFEHWHRVRGWLSGALLAGLFYSCLQFSSWNYGLVMWRGFYEARLQARALMHVINFYQPENPRLLDAEIDYARKYANYFNEQGFVQPPLLERFELEEFDIAPKPLSKVRGHLDGVEPTLEKNKWRVHGFATLDQGARPADLVILTVRQGAKENILTAVEMRGNLPVWEWEHMDFENSNWRSPGIRDRAGWEKIIALKELPKGEFVLRAYAFDVLKMRLYPLAGERTLSAK